MTSKVRAIVRRRLESTPEGRLARTLRTRRHYSKPVGPVVGHSTANSARGRPVAEEIGSRRAEGTFRFTRSQSDVGVVCPGSRVPKLSAKRRRMSNRSGEANGEPVPNQYANLG